MKRTKTFLILIVFIFGLFSGIYAQEHNKNVIYVDLGLPSGNLWANKNLGAYKPDDTGNGYTWGETGKEVYNDRNYWSRSEKCNYWSKNGWNYKYGDDGFTLTKYCTDSYYGYHGYSDNLTVLCPEDDAATVVLGDGWYIPTREDWDELISHCTIKREEAENEFKGLRFTGPNGKSIFLPYPRYSNTGYWSSSLNTEVLYSAWCFDFNEDSRGMYYYFRACRRYIRPVYSSKRQQNNDSKTNAANSPQPASSSLSSQNSPKVNDNNNSHNTSEVYSVVDEMPTFPGGDSEMFMFIARNVRYPQQARESGIQGSVSVSFIVEADGSLSNITIEKPLGGGCDEEAKRVIEKMPKWNPGKQNGEVVRVKKSIPISFKLQ